MLSPTPSQERDLKTSPTDCKGFVRLAGSDSQDSELVPTLAGRVVDKEPKSTVELLTLRTQCSHCVSGGFLTSLVFWSKFSLVAATHFRAFPEPIFSFHIKKRHAPKPKHSE